MWSPRRLILAGSLVILAALALAFGARVAMGAQDPSCDGLFCGGAASAALQVLALGVGLYGAILVGMGLARLDPDEREAP